MPYHEPRPCQVAEHTSALQDSLLVPRSPDVLTVGSRRWFLKTSALGMAGLGGLGLGGTGLTSARAGQLVAAEKRSVILIWLSGGPSQLDMWDPKPDAPREIRGPYQTIETAVPGMRFCEHLPLQARLAGKFSVLRAVDCSASNHTPITFQAGNALARRTDDGKDGAGYPSMGSVAARFRGANQPDMPPFLGLADSWASDVWGAGHLGSAYEPVKGAELPKRLALAGGLDLPSLREQDSLRKKLDGLERRLDRGETMASVDRFSEMAYEMLVSDRVRRSFEIQREPEAVRDRYGRDSLGEKTLLARRLVEAGVTFCLVSGAWGIFDHHGDEVRWGGIQKGLTPLLPRVDAVWHALVTDLEDRGLLDSTLVLMLGEFGRSPVMTPTNGRGHWVSTMSMLVAGGGFRHGQVIGSTDRRGGEIKERPVRPGDLAATVYRHLGIPLDTHWVNPQGRPVPIVTEGGRPIAELG